MKVQFEHGVAGFDEAMEVLALVRVVRENTRPGSHDEALLGALEDGAREWVGREEFAALRGASPLPADDRPASRRLRSLLREFIGPSRRELTLAAQRSAALERVQSAERSAFEALAETARVGRERDEALVQVLRLEQRLAELEASHSTVRGPP